LFVEQKEWNIMTEKNLPPKDEKAVPDDQRSANFSIAYLLLMLGFIGWLLFDVWIDAHTLPRMAHYDLTKLRTPLYHLFVYTVIGGAIGGIINGLRSALSHCGEFSGRFIWKYIAAPWQGAALAIIGFAIVRSTVAIFGGEGQAAGANTPQFLANFAIGALAGYGSKDVFIWLDHQVSTLFKIDTPDVTGEPVEIAEEQLQSKDIPPGEKVMVHVQEPEKVGKVISQTPKPGTKREGDQPVGLVIGTNGKKAATMKKHSQK
jgi:hypothetical protein